jgi:hypothetical protein
LIEKGELNDLVIRLDKYENLNLIIAKKLIEKGYKQVVFDNIKSFNIDSIIDLLPNKYKIIDFYREIEAT